MEKNDLPNLEWHGGPDLRSFYQTMWQYHLDQSATVIILDVGGFPGGQVVIHWSGKPAHLDFPDQQSLRVHPAFRGMGFGTRLIQCSESAVRARGYSNVGLSVNVANDGARRLYERLGYSAIGEPYDDAWSYIDANDQLVTITETVIDLVKRLD